MTFRGFIPRSEWGARTPRLRSTSIRPEGSLAHWMGTRVGHISHGRCFDYIRAVQRFHMDDRGWVDIAYSQLPCRHGYVFAGRGAGIRTAANGTNDANGRFHAIALMVGQGDDLTPDAIDAMWWSWASLGRGHIGDHRDVRSTSCPGDAIARATNSKPTTQEDDVALTPAEEQTVREIHGALEAVNSNGGFAKWAVLLIRALRGTEDGIAFADRLEAIAEREDITPEILADIADHLATPHTAAAGGTGVVPDHKHTPGGVVR